MLKKYGLFGGLTIVLGGVIGSFVRDTMSNIFANELADPVITFTITYGLSVGISGGILALAYLYGKHSKEWTTSARLTLIFDSRQEHETPSIQEGVRFYYWQSIPNLGVNFETRQIVAEPGYTLIFLSLDDPTHTNYKRAVVVGGGINCTWLGDHPAGAALKVSGDLRGRTVDIRFSKTPMPV